MAVYTATALFNSTQDSVVVPIVGIATNPPKIVGGDAVLTDVGGPPIIWLTSPSNTSVTVNTSGRFNGSVTLLIMD
jgi:hypothetical protein